MKNFEVTKEEIGDAEIFLAHWNKNCSESEFPVNLSDSDKSYLATLTNQERRLQLLSSRYLLNKMFQAYPERSSEGFLWIDTGEVISVSHKRRIAVACVAKDFKSIGIDLELVSSVNLQVKSKICNDHEYDLLAKFEEKKRLALIFSAKEALFKCHFFLGRKRFYFHDVKLERLSEHSLVFSNLIVTGDQMQLGFQTEVFYRFIEIAGEEFVLSFASIPRL